MTTFTTPAPAYAAAISGGSGSGCDIYATGANGVKRRDGSGVVWVTVDGHLRTRPAA